MRYILVLLVLVAGCKSIKVRDGETTVYVEHVVENGKTTAGTRVSFKF